MNGPNGVGCGSPRMSTRNCADADLSCAWTMVWLSETVISVLLPRRARRVNEYGGQGGCRDEGEGGPARGRGEAMHHRGGGGAVLGHVGCGSGDSNAVQQRRPDGAADLHGRG